MNRICLLFTFVILSFSALAQFIYDVAESKPYDGLNGKIKSYTEIEVDLYYIRNPDEDTPPITQTTTDFDGSGKITRISYSEFKADSSIHAFYSAVFNESGKLFKINISIDGGEADLYSVEEETSKNSTTLKFYDEENNLARVMTEMRDKKGNVIYEDDYDAETGEKEVMSYTYEYDSQDRTTKLLEFYNGELVLKHFYEYNGNEETYIMRNSEDEVYTHRVETMNDSGVVIKSKEFDDEGGIHSNSTFEYNEREELVKKVRTANIVFNVTTTTLIEFEYDELDNWISKVERESGFLSDFEVSMVTARDIEYY